MGVKWTEEQEQVIHLRDSNILVSAAAGSGKTAVLVERIIQRIMDETDPVDVDRLLVVTFTEAAAAEMKERIGAAIEKKAAEEPDNIRLEQQATLIHSAAVTTIHSFCLSVIRDHFHVIGIDPAFRVAEEGELKLLKQDVLGELLENAYNAQDEGFFEFVEKFGTGKSDRKIEEILLTLYEYSRSYPDPDEWLTYCVQNYDISYGKNGEEPELFTAVAEQVSRKMKDVQLLLNEALSVCERPDGPYMYADMLESDLKATDRIIQAKCLGEIFQAISELSWKRLSVKKDAAVDPSGRERVKELREQAKKQIRILKETYFAVPPKMCADEMKRCVPVMETMIRLVRQFAQMFHEKKQSRNMIDFSDMEQYALQILTVKQNGKRVPSSVAAEYRERFVEVMIDEYQDSNLVQEAILTSVSGISENRYNMFMVGDVKQSIYRFRLARPELFLEKYNTYNLEEGPLRRIDLHRNFRSREQVLDSVNVLFRKIMRQEFGGIVYDDRAALYPGAVFPPDEEQEKACRTELLLLRSEEMEKGDARSAEARMIARKMKELMRSGKVVDQTTGSYRNVQYRDMVILTRSIRGWAEEFTSVLAQEGIPAYSVSREGYFETYEVSVLLDYLRVLDNRRQDRPLAAVLVSHFGGLTDKDMAEVRLAFPNLPFYEAAYRCAGFGEETDTEIRPVIRKKLRKFYEQAERFRQRVPYTAIHDLLDLIIRETGYGTFLAAMPGGGQRTANIEMLIEKAAAYEGTSYKGLFHFVRYIEQLRKYDVDYGEAGIMDEQADTVRIMSIHKSKGLEFPIVFVAGMSKPFHRQDSAGGVVLHPEWGVGIDVIDLAKRTKKGSFLKKLIQEETERDNLAEEMRILYVAMTRAKEKLILTGVIKEFPAESTAAPADTVPLYMLAGAHTFLDWMFPALLRFEKETGMWSVMPDCPYDLHVQEPEIELWESAAQTKGDELALDVLEHWDREQVYDRDARMQFDEQMNYFYPYAAEGRMKLKFTVSELKKRMYLAEEAGEELYREPEIVPLIPRFLRQEEGLTGSSRGSAYHKVMELLDFTKQYEPDDIRRTLEQFCQEGRLTGEMADSIWPEDIVQFCNSRSGQRMAQADVRGLLFREQPFVMEVDASEIYPEDRSGEKILVQGIIDVYFEEEDGLTVLDYKTDRVTKAEELIEKYHTQLDYYGEALEKLTGKPVKERIIYSFALGEEIEV